MTMITIVVASTGKNLELAQKFEEQLKLLGVQTQILNLPTMNLPLFHPEADSKNDAKALLAPWYDSIMQSNAFVFLAPEYNGGIPPVLTNFIAWVSRSTKDWRAAFNGKCAAIGTFSAGNGSFVLGAMRVQLSFIGLTVLGRQVITTMAKPTDDEAIKAMSKQLVAHASITL